MRPYRSLLALLVATAGLLAPASAQDLLRLSDGSEVSGKIRSVGTTSVSIVVHGELREIPRSRVTGMRMAPDPARHGDEASVPGLTMTMGALVLPEKRPEPRVRRERIARSTPRPVEQPELVEEIEEEPQEGGIALSELPEIDRGKNSLLALLQNRFGLSPHDPVKVLLYGLLAFALVFVAVNIVSMACEFSAKTTGRVAGFSFFAVLLFLPQVVFLPAEPMALMAGAAGSLVAWCVLTKVFFEESFQKACLLLVGAISLLMLVAVAGEVGQNLIEKRAEAAPAA